ncbi:BLUF domain-containing protein [Rhodanobacter sp. BL-MT-08]
MDIFGVAYMSQATRIMSSEDMDSLLVDVRATNASIGITGVLLYGEGRFFQYFEGAEADVAGVYARIRDSRRHHQIVELEYRQIPQRLFRKWFMGFRDAPASVLQKLSQQQWSRERPWMEDHSTESPGMHELLKFLDNSVEGDPVVE